MSQPYGPSGVSFHRVSHGTGVPIVALHGAGVDHRDLAVALEPILAGRPWRRVYVDLPGMGRTIAPAAVESNDDVVEALADMISELAGGGPVLLLGHSYGGYLARGLAARLGTMITGLALVCPVGASTGTVPQAAAVRVDPAAAALIDPERRDQFEEYFVVRTAQTARRFNAAVAPGIDAVDSDALGRIFGGWRLSGLDAAVPYDGPTLIITGRQDSTAGYQDAWALINSCPRSSFAVLDGAGHAVLHERPELVQPLILDWLERCAAWIGR
jgi:pimeloyl-ACP methyl ester carboxylesterase